MLLLSTYCTKREPIASLAEKKPIDIGIWNLHLVHEFIYFLTQTKSLKKLQELFSGSIKTLYNKIKFANELRLVIWTPNKDSIELTITRAEL